ncbi:MAG: DUF2624 family protein [Bacilli bacterium]|nr:DUF2624 family protein [Bacilli bacterium]
MNQNLLKIYIKNLSLLDVKKIANKYNITLNDNEASSVFNYIKDNHDKYFNGYLDIDSIIKDASLILSKDNFNKLLNIYLKYKENN